MDAVSAFDAGFTAQVSVLPPGAKVAPNSTIDPADAGKVPGLRGHDGRYHGYNWMHSQPSRESVAGWVQQGSSVGFLASAYPAIDIDILNPEIAEAIVKTVNNVLGPCLMRTGQAPKRLLIFRCEEPLRSFDMHYERWSALLGASDKHLIQFLGRGRQYVMFGTHPVTQRPYHIDDPFHAMVLGPATLPLLTPEKVVTVFDLINSVMRRFGFDTSSNAEARVNGGEVEQDSLKAPSMTDLAALVERMPNNLPDRDDYISVGYAIKAASQDDPGLGFEAFADWCARWDQGGNDPAVVQRDWEKMVPPYRMGFDWLLQKASRLGAEVSDFRFGPAEAAPSLTSGAVSGGDDAEVEASRAALQAAAGDEDATFSDRWLAKKFLRQHGSDYMIPIGMPASYCFRWDGYHWVKTPRGEITNRVADFMTAHVPMVKQSLQESPKEAAAAAMRLGSTKTINSVVAQVTNSAVMVKEMDQLDADPDLLDTPQGPIHLPTGEVLKPKKEYLLTKATSVPMDPTGYCPRWQQFINEATRGDKQLAFLLQCLAGYCLTGHTREQVFPFFVGPGGNGKSVFLRIMQRILRDNAVSVPVELFQLSKFGGSDTSYQLAQIHGARLVMTSETKSGGVWDEQRVKQVTGEDEIVARHPYGQPFSFEARCTLIVAGNHAPDLEEVTDAMVRRIRVIPWDYKPEVVDLHLADKLEEELPGILAWCVQGAMAWYTHGLPDSKMMRQVTSDYLSDQDTMAQWMEDAVQADPNPEAIVSNRELYDSYATWCRGNGTQPMSAHRFAKRVVGPMRKIHARKHRTSTMRGWSCVSLTSVTAAPSNVVNFPASPPVAQPPPSR